MSSPGTRPSHHRPSSSEGLNFAEGFPTAYSTFTTHSARSTGRAGHATTKSLSARKRPPVLEDDTASSPPLVPLESSKKSASRPSSSSSPSLSCTSSASSSPFLGFDVSSSSSGERVSTKKSWQFLMNEFRKRRVFVAFFVVFSVLLTLGILLPPSQYWGSPPSASSLLHAGLARRPSSSAKSTVRRTGQVKREGIYRGSHRSSRQDAAPPDPTSNVQAEEAMTALPAIASASATPDSNSNNRFARWTSALFQNAGAGAIRGTNDDKVGGAGGGAQAPAVVVSAGLGDLGMADDFGSAEMDAASYTDDVAGGPVVDEDSDISREKMRASSRDEINMVPPGRRRGRSKRRTIEDKSDRDAHEHPARATRRKKLQERKGYQELEAEEEEGRSGRTLSSNRKINKAGVMERVARAIKNAAVLTPPSSVDEDEAGPANPPGFKGEDGYQHVLSEYAAAHPELVDGDETNAGLPGDLDYEEDC